ncbi:hypothetical protein ACFS5N_11505 [Mucilaginibacter ximonensis]|uniref:UDP-N-acetyl glucosamine 2-epimerase n=1 Tax=Mucilaginibacter ximonensis TaxID=538021 RepID=A0ABW5YD39_9SPHI
MDCKKKILFITGSLNQTSQMHQIAAELEDFDCWFSQLFTDSPVVNFLIKHTRLLDRTVLAGQFRANTERYLIEHGLNTDYGAKLNEYDLVVYCSDMVVPKRMRQYKTIWVQEGMTDRITRFARLIQKLGLPAWLAGNTSLNGASNICDIYCTASQGYLEHFAANGTDHNKLVVTGIPNYDNLQKFKKNSFPHRDYVMVATTDMRETFRYENRPAFIKEAVKKAVGRQLLFKLHPNENTQRAKAEIEKYAPAGTLVFDSGNTNEMIANCSELITQYSTVVYTGIVLGKKVYSWFDVAELRRRMPEQNGGSSAAKIAAICRQHILDTAALSVIEPERNPNKESVAELAVA